MHVIGYKYFSQNIEKESFVGESSICRLWKCFCRPTDFLRIFLGQEKIARLW